MYTYNNNNYHYFDSKYFKNYSKKKTLEYVFTLKKKQLTYFINELKTVSQPFNFFYKEVFNFVHNNVILKQFFFKNVLKKNLKNYFPIRFNEFSTNKFINLFLIEKLNFFYIRKNKIFNKGRYSRNRQIYRTGVY